MLSLLFPTLHTMYTVPRVSAALDQVLRTPGPSAVETYRPDGKNAIPREGPRVPPFQGRTIKLGKLAPALVVVGEQMVAKARAEAGRPQRRK